MIGTILGTIGSWYGHRRAGKAAEKAESDYKMDMQNLLTQQRSELDKLVAPDMYKDHMQSTEIQGALSQIRDQLRRQAEGIRGNVARGGLTTSAQVDLTTRQNKTLADTMSGMGMHATGLQRQATDRYMAGSARMGQMDAQHLAQLLGMGQQEAQRWAQWAQAAMMAGVNFDESQRDNSKMLMGMMGA